MNVPYTHAPESDLQRSGQLRLLVSATGEVVGLSGDSKIVSERDLWGSRIADLFDEADYFFEELCGGGHNQVQVHLRTSEYGNWVLAKGSQVRGQFRIEVSTDSVKETPSPQEVAKASAPPTPSRAAPAPTLTRSPSRANVRCVLCVDDEEMILRVYQRIFRSPTKVLLARSVDEAISLLDVHDDIDAILCDVTMPGRSGYELLRHLKAVESDLADRLAFISGGVISLKLEEAVRKSGAPFCSKPFRGIDLDQVLVQLIEPDASMLD